MPTTRSRIVRRPIVTSPKILKPIIPLKEFKKMKNLPGREKYQMANYRERQPNRMTRWFIVNLTNRNRNRVKENRRNYILSKQLYPMYFPNNIFLTKHRAASKIKRQFRKSISTPGYKLWERKLRREINQGIF